MGKGAIFILNKEKNLRMNHKIKALFFDIDGTLVSFQTHQIPASTVQALEEAKANGVQAVSYTHLDVYKRQCLFCYKITC